MPRGLRVQDPELVVTHPAANRITAGEQRRPARCANFRGAIEVRETHSFGGHAVKIGSADGWVTVAAQITVAEVVGEDDDDVRLLLVSGVDSRRGGNDASYQ